MTLKIIILGVVLASGIALLVGWYIHDAKKMKEKKK